MNLAIIGTGDIARTMATTVNQMKDINLFAVASRSYEHAQAFAEEYKVNNFYDSYDEMLINNEIDLVYIATPHSEHFAHVMQCLKNNKNVLCEKAFTVNAKQAEELINEADARNLFICEAMWTRFMPLTKKLKEIVDAGTIGDISMVTANLNFPMLHKERLIKNHLAGGALLDVGIYAVTFASIVLGDDIEEIEAMGVLNDDGVDMYGTYSFKYKNKKIASLNSGMCSISDGKGVIYGDKGVVVVSGINNLISIEVYDCSWNMVAEYERPEQITGYEYEVKACMEAIKSGKRECCEISHAQTVRIMKILDDIRVKLNVKYSYDC